MQICCSPDSRIIPQAKPIREVIINRIALVGGTVAAFGFFFLPLIFLKPNQLSPTGVSFNLLELQNDFRYIFLFLLSLLPFALAVQKDTVQRGYFLVLLGNLLIVLSIYLPTIAGEEILANAADYLTGTVRRAFLQPVSAIATGVAGGVIILFGGLNDLKQTNESGFMRFIASWFGILIVFWLFFSGELDVYSTVIEYNINGGNLLTDILRHLTYVLVALVVGLILGVGLGLWASRDDRVAPIILYVVGIIQTLPSLALFGLLLVPLSTMGGQLIVDALLLLVALTLVAGVFIAGIVTLTRRLAMPKFANTSLIILAALVAVPPLALAALIMVSFLFRVSFSALTSPDYVTAKAIFVLAFLATSALAVANRRMRLSPNQHGQLTNIRLGVIIIGALAILVVLVQSALTFLPVDRGFNTWTLNNIGIRGIGVTPTLVALTLYSLLPLVRNTYAGLNNVDPAIIDSGKGMGMTARQIFFQIELPLAFPIIMAGVRNAAVALVGIATIATVIGGGGLGDYVISGINNVSIDKIMVGTIPAILLAFALDIGLRIFENTFTSPGIRQMETTL